MQLPLGRLVQTGNQSLRTCGVRKVNGGELVPGQSLKSIQRANPEVALVVEQGQHSVVDQRIRIAFAVLENLQGPVGGIVAIEPCGVATEPQGAVLIRCDGIDIIHLEISQSCVVDVYESTLRRCGQHTQTATLAGDPESLLRVHMQGLHNIGGQRVRVFRIVTKDLESNAIVAGKAVRCANPQIALGILRQRIDRAGGQAVLRPEVLELRRFRQSMGGRVGSRDFAQRNQQ